MSTRRVITQESATRLNELAQSISPILFWTCNYEPTIDYAIGYDAEFQLGIQDLYKFAIDTNCLLKSIAFSPEKSICRDILTTEERKDLGSIINTIQVLRGCIDHNQSNMNGRLSIERREQFESWIQSSLGKDKPVSQDDYRVLYMSLLLLGDSLLKHSEAILLRILERRDREQIIDGWISATLHWYCIGSRQEYYRSQLSDYYIIRAQRVRTSFLRETNDVDLRKRVNSWIRCQTTHRLTEAIRCLEREEREILDSISCPNSFSSKFKAQSPEVYNSILLVWKTRLEEIKTELQAKKDEKESIENIIHVQFQDKEISYFFDSVRLERQLRETHDSLAKSDKEYTLLPQDILYEDVCRNFSHIPSPYNDF